MAERPAHSKLNRTGAWKRDDMRHAPKHDRQQQKRPGGEVFATGLNYSLYSIPRKMTAAGAAKPQAAGRLGFQVAERDIDVGKTRVQDTAPIAAAAARAAIGFGSPLALDAAG